MSTARLNISRSTTKPSGATCVSPGTKIVASSITGQPSGRHKRLPITTSTALRLRGLVTHLYILHAYVLSLGAVCLRLYHYSHTLNAATIDSSFSSLCGSQSAMSFPGFSCPSVSEWRAAADELRDIPERHCRRTRYLERVARFHAVCEHSRLGTRSALVIAGCRA